jgi:hypothetical protein
MRTYLGIDLELRRFYVGSTKNFDRRWKDHLSNKDNLPFQNVLRKRPETIFWVCSEEDGLETREEEQFYLDFYHGSEWCYNICSKAGDPPYIPPEERSERSKELHRRLPDLAKRMGEESQRKNPGKGAETLLRYMKENPDKNRENAVKAGQASGRKHAKPVVCVETGVEYPSAKEAMRQTGINDANIGTSCKSGKRAGGYHWKYSEPSDLTLV